MLIVLSVPAQAAMYEAQRQLSTRLQLHNASAALCECESNVCGLAAVCCGIRRAQPPLPKWALGMRRNRFWIPSHSLSLWRRIWVKCSKEWKLLHRNSYICYTHKCIQFGCNGINFARNKSSKRQNKKMWNEKKNTEKTPYENAFSLWPKSKWKTIFQVSTYTGVIRRGWRRLHANNFYPTFWS